MKSGLFTFLFCVFICLAVCTPPLPKSYTGHRFGNVSGQILFEAYFDHLCPDSKASWPVIKQVIQHYEKNLYFILHMFPLPYHHNAFYSTQAGLVIEQLTNSFNWWNWLEIIFQNQDAFSNIATQNQTPTQVIAAMAKLATPLGVSTQDFINGMAYGDDEDADARIAWKYACTRGVYGTPIFYVNGLFVTDDSWSFAQWKSLIDELLSSSPSSGFKRSRK